MLDVRLEFCNFLEVDVYEDDKYYSSTALHSRKKTFFFNTNNTVSFFYILLCYVACLGGQLRDDWYRHVPSGVETQKVWVSSHW